MNIGANFNTSFEDISGSVGAGGQQKTTGTAKTTGSKQATKRQGLVLDADSIQQILTEVLSQSRGLNEVLAGEGSADVFNADARAAASGDFAAKLIGEIAKLSAQQVSTRAETTKADTATNQKIKAEQDSLKDSIFSSLGLGTESSRARAGTELLADITAPGVRQNT